MTQIQIKDLSFCYDESYEDVFSHLSLTFDSTFKTALIGRNARGKTTFLKLLMGEYEFQGDIIKNVVCEYFPYQVHESHAYTLDVCYEMNPFLQQWQLERELRLLEVDSDDVFYRPFETLSQGEQTKVLLAVLFLKNNAFLLIDEPTNHLDQKARESVARYLKKQQGFLLVSHDRVFIDMCCDHVIALNPNSVEVMKGNFSTWFFEKQKRDEREISRNMKLKKDIEKLEESRRRTSYWSDQVEKSKNGAFDKGHIGHMAAKMMKRSKSIEKRKNHAIEEKKSLLKDIEEYDDLKIFPKSYFQPVLIAFYHVSLFYDQKILFHDLTFSIEKGDRMILQGRNGCGKSSVISLIISQGIQFHGEMIKGSRLKISYVPQDCSKLSGNIDELIEEYDVDETLVKTLLRKLGFSRHHFEYQLEQLSEGQKKKVMLAISLATSAHLYIWDEPFNYIDIFSRMQIEKLILTYQPTLLCVEHDAYFQQKIATKIIDFDELV